MNMRLSSFLVVSMLSVIPLTVSAQPSDHGDSVILGTVEVAGKTLTVTRFGAVVPEKEAAFQVDGDSSTKLAELDVYLSVEDANGKQVSAPAKGIIEGKVLHFHLTPKAGTSPKNVLVRVRANGKDEKATLPLGEHQASGVPSPVHEHGHEHGHTPEPSSHEGHAH